MGGGGLGIAGTMAGAQSIELGDTVVRESVGQVLIPIDMNYPYGSSTFEFGTVPGSAQDGADFVGASSLYVNFPTGRSRRFAAIDIVNDSTDEGSTPETFTFELLGPRTWTSGPSRYSCTITVVDDDATSGGLAVVGGGALEGIGRAGFSVVRSGNAAGECTVDFSTAGVTATPDGDYVTTSGTLTLANGEWLSRVQVPVYHDNIHEATQSFAVGISNPVGASIASPTGTWEIENDDISPDFEIYDIPSTSEAKGSVIARVVKTGVTELSAEISFSTGPEYGSPDATPGVDYQETTGTLTFAPDVFSQDISIPIYNDSDVEAVEYVLITIADGTFSNGEPASVDGCVYLSSTTIIDDDGKNTVFSLPGNLVANEADGSVPVTITLDPPVPYATSVELNSIWRDARGFGDLIGYTAITVNFPANTPVGGR